MRVPDFEAGFDAAVLRGFFAGGQVQADQSTGDRQCAARRPLRSFLLLVHAHAPYPFNFQSVLLSLAQWVSFSGKLHPIKSASANSALAEKRHAQNYCPSTRSMAGCHVPVVLFFGNWGRHLKSPRHRHLHAKKTSHRCAMLAFKMVPIIGFELMTYRLQGGCSTN